MNPDEHYCSQCGRVDHKCVCDQPMRYPISGYSSAGQAIYHPRVFQQMVRDGVIDEDGWPSPKPPPYPADDEDDES